MKIGLNIGNGFGFDGNKLTLNLDTNELLKKNEDGVYVASLNGNNGTSSGSVVDGVTVRDVNGVPGLNLENVMCIYSMCAYKIIDHTTKYDTFNLFPTNSDSVKKVYDIINELNYDITSVSGNGNVPYIIKQNDLLLLRNIAIQGASCINKVGHSIEDGNRYPSSVPYAVFTVDEISYSELNEKRCTSLTITCLWVDTETNVASVYEVGTSYSA